MFVRLRLVPSSLKIFQEPSVDMSSFRTYCCCRRVGDHLLSTSSFRRDRHPQSLRQKTSGVVNVSLCQRITRAHLHCSSTRLTTEMQGLGTGKSARVNVDLDPTAEKYMIDNELKPKQHPGVYHLKRMSLPDKFVQAAVFILSHENVKYLEEEALKLRNLLWSRELPIENAEYKAKVDKIEDSISSKEDILRPFLSEKQLERLDNARDNKIRYQLKQSIYHWEPTNYDRNKALQYLLLKSPSEYAALLQIFTEISRRDKSFLPKTLYDFGSGIGTVVWACKSAWPKGIREVTCTDVSRDMSNIAERLLRGGSMHNDHGFAALYFRQFLAQSSRIPYDIVVSAYSLLELPSLKDRLRTLDILWKKTNKYLVVVEQGTPNGFKAVIEARDYILQLDRGRDAAAVAHVFSPCPHDYSCPRSLGDRKACKFYVKYKTLYPFHEDKSGTEVFSYVVLKKGARDREDERWPRLIRDPIVNKGHCICRLCTKSGKLSEVVLTKTKHSQMLYRVGRKSGCGDMLPVKEVKDLDVSSKYEAHSGSESDSEEELIDDSIDSPRPVGNRK